MAKQVCMGAVTKCSFGVAPSSLVVLPQNRVTTTFMPDANIMDHIPIVNIVPFGMCQSQSNPAVIAATAAALGTPTPAPCIPVTPSPWDPGSSSVTIAGQPALNDSSTLDCIWGGKIEINFAGQATVSIP
ncbi:MAG: DUF4280 domain-containing protein [Zetaproteobacteria bacterium CG06_land_8_20_14_3_00_59_53]|nr:MAG: hypothetical protein AUK36_03565 [Zetaproteobacteria bacterium CG2_30_59_37]PIO89926.1 MAG: hypothetical protein COX56_06025 [Zetaproteobacteria bacterium CG23_combo_of_CG06-09_8_20_14_all_59_86]PIQ64291.1 MAG: hypothetical protein COV97_10280 [Zetaproteobacteria bacterium CG11_big_fil_rev_8_21_14_0_20_59_439]PIU70363.1 MAG: DUF4280 domain-containing protein [Zetaproteobacteria bacterium CG06_land_8_20_14_3_00_59_53]PIU97514.1 MAG: DUF4280 domain-containing protein [Zetaproteobacteria b